MGLGFRGLELEDHGASGNPTVQQPQDMVSCNCADRDPVPPGATSLHMGSCHSPQIPKKSACHFPAGPQ